MDVASTSPQTPASGTAALRGPVTGGERAATPDVARGFMLLLIALAHASLYVRTEESVLMNHPVGGSALDRAVTFAGVLVMDNRAYPMFAALFGFGMATMVARQLAAGATAKAASRLLRRRGLFLLLFGYIHFCLIFPSDILGPYGLAAIVIGWVIVRGGRTLNVAVVVTGVIAVVVATLLSIALAFSNDPHGNSFRGTLWARDYGEAVLARLQEAPFADIHVMIGWPILPAILVGAIAARRGYLDDPVRHRAVLRRVALVGLPISVAGAIPIALVAADLWHPSGLVTGLITTVDIVTGFIGGLAYVAVFGLISARRKERGGEAGPVFRAISAVGRRSLTCYVLQTSLLTVFLAGYTLNIGDRIHATGAALFALGVWLTGVMVASLLERAGRRGPLDALLRRLVYGRGQRAAVRAQG
ncbi:DUF418 domain-containing protein [Streptosporangium sp. NPDC048865]|uniref:DUF418 domain-containing protein n=1 Tax=Streptosporangium sp. NPDC048865 TaxID=3155766 RepID=UPI003442E739